MLYNWILSDKYKNAKLRDIYLDGLGVNSTDAINDWFIKSYKNLYQIKGFEDIKQVLDEHPDLVIYIFGDYDVDGRTATAILVHGLTIYGRIVRYRIPKRVSEGFGLNINMVNEIQEDKAIIITCDNGIAAVEAVREAKNRGHIVIITDHHLPTIEDDTPIYPNADIIIDPNAIEGSADFNGYCGAGIAYKFIKFLIGKQEAKILLPLAAIATVCDAVPLREENYVFVRDGLRMINKRLATPGVLSLIDTMNVENATSENIGFKIGPPINAPGRLYDEDGVTLPLLLTNDYKFANILSSQIKEVNEKRKEMKANGIHEANEYIEKNHIENDPMLILKLPVHEGIIGIIAGELAEKYQRPSLVFTEVEMNGIKLLKGSARSTENIDIKSVLDKSERFLYKYGGHPGAAGVTIRIEDFEPLKESLNNTVRPLLKQSHEGVLHEYIAEIECKDVQAVLDEQELFEPFGEMNRRPVYKVTDFVVIPIGDTYKRELASNGIKLKSSFCDAICFGLDGEIRNIDKPTRLILYGELSYNVFRGKKTPQINFIDYEIISSNDTEFARRLKAM